MSATPAVIPAPATLAILGGGQLGRYFVAAAQELGYRVIVLDPDANAPAGKIANEHLIKGYDDADALAYLAQHCAAATTEFENVPAASLATLAAHMPVHPSADAVTIAQDRIREKRFLRDHGLATAPFITVEQQTDLDAAGDDMFPAILKIARFGYDGKGQARIADRAQAIAAWQQFGTACVLEKMVPLDAEVSVVLARNAHGDCQCFTPAENIHRHGILDVSITPARIGDDLLQQAQAAAQALAQEMDYVGVLAVEFFISNGQLLINEMAPRPHNSGHYTIDSCVSSQYEQQVRALCSLPLGDARPHSAAVMVNLLGDLWFDANGQGPHEPDWTQLNRVPTLKLHMYGKLAARPGRKMGHFTVLDQARDSAVQTALDARRAIGIKDD